MKVATAIGNLARRDSVRRLENVALGVLVVLAAALLYELLFDRSRYQIGIDFYLYRSAASRWLAGGSFYWPHQLAGPYIVHGGWGTGDILYPPVALWLLVPFVYLPDPLWWAIPMLALTWALWRLRPASWTWPILLLIALDPRTPSMFLWGNPAMWAMAAYAYGLLWAGPAVAVLIKPSLAPFAMAGMKQRRWWYALAVFALACAPFGSLWVDYWHVIANGNLGPIYSLADYIPMLLPLVAWIGRRRAIARIGASRVRVPYSTSSVQDLTSTSAEIAGEARDPLPGEFKP